MLPEQNIQVEEKAPKSKWISLEEALAIVRSTYNYPTHEENKR